MKHKNNVPFFIKITTFVYLTWFCHIYKESVLNHFVEGNYILYNKLNMRNYRVLEQCKQNKHSNIIGLGKEILNNDVSNHECISDNEKKVKSKNNQLSANLSKKTIQDKHFLRKKTCIFETKKYSHLEKNIFKEIDFIEFLKNNRTISNKTYKKMILKKYRLRLVLPLLIFMSLLISLILDYSCDYGILNGLINLLNISLKKWFKPLHNLLESYSLDPLLKKSRVIIYSGENCIWGYTSYVPNFFGLIIYILPFFILGVTIITVIMYYHKQVKKYQKIKFRKR
ncbi:fam-l protein [Plasmodium malariae]|uniref:Fam-l protein n=1 Tax=Plasmodium malariae TaxID=5858 RepID=A0A1D3JHT0_PLAMA|nr:fam-l protein [Plasmodium malariae]SBT85758.1 fam-l protein [Plasmodium malariae]